MNAYYWMNVYYCTLCGDELVIVNQKTMELEHGHKETFDHEPVPEWDGYDDVATDFVDYGGES